MVAQVAQVVLGFPDMGPLVQSRAYVRQPEDQNLYRDLVTRLIVERRRTYQEVQTSHSLRQPCLAPNSLGESMNNLNGSGAPSLVSSVS